MKLFRIWVSGSGVLTFKRFPIRAYGGPLVQWSEIFNSILKEGIMRILHVELYEIWTSG